MPTMRCCRGDLGLASKEPALATRMLIRTPLADPDASLDAYLDAITLALTARRTTLDYALAELGEQAGTLAAIADRLVSTLRGGHKVLVAGNGGSAAEAQHFTAELVGRFKRERA